MNFKTLYIGDTEKLSQLKLLNNIANHAMFSSSRKENALAIATREKPDWLLIDFDCVECEPLDFLRQVRSELPDLKMIGLAENPGVNLVMQATRSGINEFVSMSDAPQKLADILRDLQHSQTELDRGQAFHRRVKSELDFSNIIGDSEPMQRVFEVLRKVTHRKWVTVLVRGETGTGKELIAKALHYQCFEDFHPFVEINCNALPETLLESELFGYEKGAFTDAKTRKIGLFEAAQNGTIFLDEIGDISPAVQVKLLKALEEKKIRRVGGTEEIPINCRIIAATNKDLQAAIAEGSFRSDLYYRLNVVTIQLPPLRDRGNDIVLIANHFLQQYAKEYDSPIKGFSDDATTMLRSYDWPGNIRELSHTIERIVLLSDGDTVTKTALAEAIESETPLLLTENRTGADIEIDIPENGISFDEIEAIVIRSVLKKNNWNKLKTSQMLRIARTRLDRKIVKYGLSPDGPEDAE